MKKLWIILTCVALLLAMTPLAAGADAYGLGNVDGEGDITANDALLALQAATNKVALSTAQMLAADVDSKDSVTANDALLILQYATRKIDQFPSQNTGNDTATVDLEGATIIIAGMDSCYFALDGTASSWDQRIVEELETIETELNCKFKLTQYSSTYLTDQCIKATQAGMKFSDIIITNVWQQKSLMAAGALADLNEVDGLDITQSYWDQNARKSMELYGKNFIAFPSLDSPGANANVLFFNKTLAKQTFDKLGQNVSSPEEAGKKLYQMVEDGQWTFEQFRALSRAAVADLTGDGEIDDRNAKDQYGFAGVDIRGGVSYSIFKANGGYFTEKDSDGNVVYALDKESNIAALQTTQDWMLQETSFFNSDRYGNNHLIGIEAFTGGRVLFLGASSGNAENFTDMEDDWGILPYPKKDENGTYAGVADWNTQGFSIPRYAQGKDRENAAIVMDTIARRFQTIRLEQEEYMADQVYRDTNTQRMLDIITQTASVEFCQFGDLKYGGLSVLHYLFDNPVHDAKGRVLTIYGETTAALDTFLNAVK